MNRAMAIVITTMLVSGSALAQTPLGQQPPAAAGQLGAAGASSAALGAITPGMIATAVAVVAVGAAVFSSGDNTQTTGTH